MRKALLLLAAALPLAAEVKTVRFLDRDSWVIDTPILRVTMIQSGGHIAEIVLKDSGVNPLWIQKHPTIDAERYDRAQHEAFYGGGPGARLMAGLLGHNVCFPFWGNPSDSEYAAGMTYHGETGITRWKPLAMEGDSFTASADLPESLTRFTRKLRVSGQVVIFEETGENRGGWDRPLGWCEHVTIGPPFLEKGVTRMEGSFTKGRFLGDPPEKAFAWPQGTEASGGARFDVRTVRDIPKSAFVNNYLVDPKRETAFLAAYHPKHRLVFGYVWRRAEFGWLNLWEANNDGMLTRGLEFSNSPTHGTLKALIQRGELWGVPAYEWLNARTSITKRFAAFSARVPEGYRGVADVRWSEGRIDIIEKETGKTTGLVY